METVKLTNYQWTQIEAFLRAYAGVYVGAEADCRRFLEAVLWVMRSGSAWRLLPAEYGKWNTIYKRFARWSNQGVWQALFEYFKQDPELEYLIVDSTIVRAHPSAAGASKKKAVKRPKP